MSVIIVATDFSEIADNAVRYACSMAQTCHASVVIVHSFIIPVTFSDTPMPVMPVDEAREIAEERLQEILQKYKQTWPQTSIQTKVLYGELIDSLQDYITEENKNPWLIVIGNSETGENSIWSGNTVVASMRNMSCPVIAVPDHASFTQVKNVCFACDIQHVEDLQSVNELSSLIATTGAKLHVLSIANNRSSTELQTMDDTTQLHQLLEQMTPEYHYESGTDPDQQIIDFVTTHHMDWLIVAPHRYSFFERLFHKSHTKAITRMCDVPVVALPVKAVNR